MGELFFGVFGLGCQCGSVLAVEGEECDEDDECAEGLWCLGRVCAAQPPVQGNRDAGPGGRGDGDGAADGKNACDTAENAGECHEGGGDTGKDVDCVPDCSGKECGENGCGGTCPDSCVFPQTCGGGGAPNVCGCTPQCSGKCGGAADGCGGACKQECQGSTVCQGGSCAHCGEYGEPCCASDACKGPNECNRGTCVSNTCLSKGDFTLCKKVDDIADRAYDICVGQVCVSPGCGGTSCNTGGPHFPLPDTGQRECYDTSNQIPCPTGVPAACNQASPEAFCGQDAQYGWDVLHPQTARFTVTETVPGQPVVADSVTGLTWQRCPAAKTGSDCAEGSYQDETWTDAVAYCDGLYWAGKSGWHLPDFFELQTIIDYGSYPAPGTAAFPATPEHSFFWSSSSYVGVESTAWGVYFNNVYLGYAYKAETGYVRCVRGGVPVGARFDRTEPVTGEPVVADNVTGLAWQGCAAGLSGSKCDSGSATQYGWREALSYCEGLNHGNQNDWRLPNVNELASIMDDRRSTPSIDMGAFPGTPGEPFFSSSSNAEPNNADAWSVRFDYGFIEYQWNADYFNVRCVRGGL